MRSAYRRFPCPVCTQEISSAGCAWVNHMRKHVREGKATEHVDFQPFIADPTYYYKDVKTGKVLSG